MSLSRQMRRLSEKEGKRLQALPWNEFRDRTKDGLERLSIIGDVDPKYWPDQIFSNNKFIVQIFLGRRTIGGVAYDKAMIRRSDAHPVVAWGDLQRVKDEVFGPEIEAIQFFPKRSELIDAANLYWLWVPSGKWSGPA